ncbi:MAG: hypothetical protein KDK34_12565 [Leptospiraceae bacterium]|nr:hypothetical protein [Leptospiraceae bacterium]
MPAYKIFFLWLHLLAVIVWVGGILYRQITVLLVLDNQNGVTAEIADKLATRTGTFIREAFWVIVVTGLLNLGISGYERQFDFSAPFLNAFSIKMLLVIILFALQVAMQHSVFPAEIRAHEQQSPDSGMRKKAWVATALSLIIAMATVLFGLVLRYL